MDDKIITHDQAWEAWRELHAGIQKIRNALHELDQVSSTLMVYLDECKNEASMDTD